MVWILPLLLLGFSCGVIVNYLADILPISRKLSKPFCPYCGSAFDLKNYILWPRRCPYCRQKRRSRTYVVEAFFALLTIYLWFEPNPRINFILSLLIWIYFVLVIVIDLEHRLILHPVSISGVILGSGIGIGMHGVASTLLGGIIGFLIMLVLYYTGIILLKLVRKHKKDETLSIDEQSGDEALGFGDVNLSGVVGLLLGWPGIIAGITLTIFLAGGFSLFYIIYMLINKKYRAYMAIPYGPFIILGAAILLYFVK